MTDAITWTNDTRKLSDLVPWEHNPKRMSKKQGEGLRVSLDKFGLAIPLCISPENDLYDGHQRKPLLEAMKQYGPSATVDVRVSSRVFTDEERREFVIRLRQNQAGWDFDMLANEWDKEKLIEWGMDFLDDGIDPNAEWAGMPEFEEAPGKSYQTIAVHFNNAEEVKAFGILMGQSFTEKTRYAWFSERQTDTSTSKDERYVNP